MLASCRAPPVAKGRAQSATSTQYGLLLTHKISAGHHLLELHSTWLYAGISVAKGETCSTCCLYALWPMSQGPVGAQGLSTTPPAGAQQPGQPGRPRSCSPCEQQSSACTPGLPAHTDAEGLSSSVQPVCEQGTVFTQSTATAQWPTPQHASHCTQLLSFLAAGVGCPAKQAAGTGRAQACRRWTRTNSPVHPTALCCRSLEGSAGWPHRGSRPLHRQGTLGCRLLQRGGARTKSSDWKGYSAANQTGGIEHLR